MGFSKTSIKNSEFFYHHIFNFQGSKIFFVTFIHFLVKKAPKYKGLESFLVKNQKPFITLHFPYYRKQSFEHITNEKSAITSRSVLPSCSSFSSRQASKDIRESQNWNTRKVCLGVQLIKYSIFFQKKINKIMNGKNFLILLFIYFHPWKVKKEGW